MDYLDRYSERVQSLLRPGHANDPMAGDRSAAGPGNSIAAAEYVTWSGASYTTHKRIVLGWTGYGLGGELA